MNIEKITKESTIFAVFQMPTRDVHNSKHARFDL